MLKRNEKPFVLQQGKEAEIYARLGRRLFFPTYLLFQATGYPLSALSSYLETDRYHFYNRFNTYSDMNILRSIGSGFEEPYAFSLFLGNILLLVHTDSLKSGVKQSGSALAGFIISHGRHQIHNNIYLQDAWYQIELMLIGNLKEPLRRRLSWNFRIGAKLHQNRFFRDVMTLSLERSHTDWRFRGWSLVKNSFFKYQGYFPSPFSHDKKFAGLQMISYGKKFPAKLFQKKLFFTFGLGVRWEWVRFYDHRFNKFEADPSQQMTWLIQPNIEF